LNIKYFQDTDTLLVAFTGNDVVETRDLSEKVLLDLDKDGNIVNMTIEHAREKANIDEFSFQQIHGHTVTMA
jgi:uncharacterized protein YuzE